MDKNIIVSVCMVTYNHEKFIRHAITSVLNQKTSFEFEIIVGDDCSKDDTVEVIKQLQKENPSRIRLIERKENIGMCVNSYDVRCHAKGKYIAMLEGDDYWIDPNKLQKQVEYLEEHSNASAIAGCMGVVNEREHPLGSVIPEIEQLNRFFGKEDAIKYKTELFHPGSVMYRNFIKNNREKYNFLGHSNKTFGGHMLLVFLLASMGDIYISSDIVGMYRLVKRTRASNANSMFFKNTSFGKWSTLDCLLYMKKVMKSQYRYSEMIVEEYVKLGQFFEKTKERNRKKRMMGYLEQLEKDEILALVRYYVRSKKMKYVMAEFHECKCDKNRR